ncbi:dihydrodipicolinate synthase family protein [Pseudonocardia spinosispora]|uniref:dihydrodipicolinate synthase family protein n=1 Tax=Pseudonocardia spinosispora TaxID=103441 RepID=UPI000403ABA0|nr:dihydrodipicolinate synthase family protein [Pseudonocardia spinosispora]
MSAPTIQGIVAYPVTPFTSSGSGSNSGIDTDALAKLIDKLVESGVHAIAPLGSTGESAYLTDEEWHTVAERTISAVAGRVPTVVGISDLTTAGAVRRAVAAQRYGADTVMLLPASYWKLSERELLRHFTTVAGAIDLPIMVYNNPATSGIDMSPDFLVHLVEHVDNITMIKESSGDITRMQRIAQLTDGRVPFFNGSNPLIFQALAAGAAGWCTAAPCLIPRHCLNLWDAMQSGSLTDARRQFRDMLPILEFILNGGLPTTVKAGLRTLGLDVGEPRLPLLPLEEPETRHLASLLSNAHELARTSA